MMPKVGKRSRRAVTNNAEFCMPDFTCPLACALPCSASIICESTFCEERKNKERAMLAGKTILLAISGGIAAYKAAEITRLLVKEGALVRVLMTKNAQEFITPLTLQTLSG